MKFPLGHDLASSAKRNNILARLRKFAIPDANRAAYCLQWVCKSRCERYPIYVVQLSQFLNHHVQRNVAGPAGQKGENSEGGFRRKIVKRAMRKTVDQRNIVGLLLDDDLFTQRQANSHRQLRHENTSRARLLTSRFYYSVRLTMLPM